MAGNLTSREISVAEVDSGSVHCKWVAGPTGTFSLQAQNHPNDPDSDAWYTLDTGTPWTIAAGDNEAVFVLTQIPFAKLRLVYTASTGSGTLDARLMIKSLGA